MPRIVTANGKEFTFDDDVSNEQIAEAIDEYFAANPSPSEKKNKSSSPSSKGTSQSNGSDTKMDAGTTPLLLAKPDINKQLNTAVTGGTSNYDASQKPIAIDYANEDKIAAAKTTYRNSPFFPQGISDKDLHKVISEQVEKNPDAFTKITKKVKQKEEWDNYLKYSDVNTLLINGEQQISNLSVDGNTEMFDQSREGKVFHYINNVREGKEVAPEDLNYLKEVAPKAFEQLFKGQNPQQVISQNRAIYNAYNDKLIAQGQDINTKAVYQVAQVEGIADPQQIHDNILSTPYISDLSAKVDKREEDKISELQQKYPLENVGNPNYGNDFQPRKDRPAEYYAELKALNDHYAAVQNAFANTHATELARSKKDDILSGKYPVREIGLANLQVQDPEQFSLYQKVLKDGKTNNQVEANIERLGIYNLKATGDPALQARANVIETKFFQNHPDQLHDETLKLLSARYYDKVGFNNFSNNPMAGTDELDVVANGMPKINKDDYYNYIRKNAIDQRSGNSFNPNVKSSTGVVQLMNPAGLVNSAFDSFTNPIISMLKAVADHIPVGVNIWGMAAGAPAKVTYLRNDVDMAQEKLSGTPVTKQLALDPDYSNQIISSLETKAKTQPLSYDEHQELQNARGVIKANPWGRQWFNAMGGGMGFVGALTATSVVGGELADFALASKAAAIQEGIATGVSAATTAQKTAEYSAILLKTKGTLGAIDMGLVMYDDARKKALELMPDDKDAGYRALYAYTKAALWATASRIIPFETVIQNLSPTAENQLLGLVKDISTGKVTKEALASRLGKLADGLLIVGGGTLKDAAKVTAEMTTITAAEGVIDEMANPKKFNVQQYQDALLHTITHTAIDFLPISLMGGIRALNSKSVTIPAIVALGYKKNADAFKEATTVLLAKKEITPAKANLNFRVANTMQDIHNKEMPLVNQINPKLSETAKDAYQAHLLSESMLKRKIHELTSPDPESEIPKNIAEPKENDEPVVKKLKEQVAENKSKREKILGRDYVVTDDYEVKTVKEANEEIKNAQTPEALGTVDATAETAPKGGSRLGEPTVSKVDDGDLYEWRTDNGLVAGVMISPTEFRIDGISANEVGKGEGSKMFENLIIDLKEKGVTTISTVSAGDGAKAMHQKAVDKGLLERVSEDGRNATFSIKDDTATPVTKPTIDQQLKDVKEGNTVSFTYEDESEVPEVFKDKISSSGEINGKKYVRVTVAKSLADYELAKDKKSGILHRGSSSLDRAASFATAGGSSILPSSTKTKSNEEATPVTDEPVGDEVVDSVAKRLGKIDKRIERADNISPSVSQLNNADIAAKDGDNYVTSDQEVEKQNKLIDKIVQWQLGGAEPTDGELLDFKQLSHANFEGKLRTFFKTFFFDAAVLKKESALRVIEEATNSIRQQYLPQGKALLDAYNSIDRLEENLQERGQLTPEIKSQLDSRRKIIEDKLSSISYRIEKPKQGDQVKIGTHEVIETDGSKTDRIETVVKNGLIDTFHHNDEYSVVSAEVITGEQKPESILSKQPTEPIQSKVGNSVGGDKSTFGDVESPIGIIDGRKAIKHVMSMESFKQDGLLGINIWTDKDNNIVAIGNMQDINVPSGAKNSTIGYNAKTDKLWFERSVLADGVDADKIKIQVESLLKEQTTEPKQDAAVDPLPTKANESVSVETPKQNGEPIKGAVDSPTKPTPVRVDKPVFEEGKTTLSGLTEAERQAEIAKRNESLGISKERQDESNLAQKVKKFNLKSKDGGIPMNKVTERAKLRNEIKVEAKRLGYTIGYDTLSMVDVFKAGKKKGKVAIQESLVDRGPRSISPKGKALHERSEEFQRQFVEVSDLDIPFEFRNEFDNSRFLESQTESSYEDILNGIPSVQATKVLDTIQKAIETGTIEVGDSKQGFKGIPLKEAIQEARELQKEELFKDMTEDEVAKMYDTEFIDDNDNLIKSLNETAKQQGDILQTPSEGENTISGTNEESTIPKGTEKEAAKETAEPTPKVVSDISKSLNVDDVIAKKIEEIAATAKDLEDFGKQVNELLGESHKLQAGNKDFVPITKEAHEALVAKLKEAFPKAKVIYNKEEFAAKAGNSEELKTPNGVVYGAKFEDGTIYLNPDTLNGNTPVHEFSHLFEQYQPQAFNQGVQLIKQTIEGRNLFKELRKNEAYKNKSDEEIWKEALNTLIGNKGENFKSKSIQKRFTDWLKFFFKQVGNKLGFTNLSPDERLERFTEVTLGKMFAGKEITDKSKVKSPQVQFEITMPDGSKRLVRELPEGLDIVNGFYSPIEKKLLETKIEKQSANKWLTSGLIGKGDEANFTGVKAWLESKNPQEQVSKADIKQYMKDNRIQIVEVVKGDKLKEYAKKRDEAEEKAYDLGTQANRLEYVDKNYKEAEEIRKQAYQWTAEAERLEGLIGTGDTGIKFSQYQQEGQRDNYKEVLITMPNRSTEVAQGNIDTFKQSMRDKYGNGWRDKMSNPERKNFDALANGENKTSPEFKSSHFSEPNILAHVRMNTRTDAEGNKVLFVEEFQRDVEKEHSLNGKEAGLPFSKTTDYTKLAFKYALRHAVEEGAGRVAWTTGEQQNDRYDLSKQVDKIEVEAVFDVDNLHFVDITLSNGTVENLEVENGIIREGNYKGQRLDNVIGKDYADKILSTPQGENVTLQGADLKVGGKGMIGFYGSPSQGKEGIVGNVAKALVKELTGKEGKIVDTKIDTGKSKYNVVFDDGKKFGFNSKSEAKDYADKQGGKYTIEDNSSTQHSIEITPELRAAVEQGMPQFQIKMDGPLSERIKSIYEEAQKNKKREEEEAQKQAPIEPPKQENGAGNKPPDNTIGEGVGTPKEEGEEIGIRHKDTEVIREQLDLGEYDKTKETIDEWDKEADTIIKNGFDGKKLVKKLEDGVLPTHIEQRLMLKYISDLKDKVNKDSSEENIDNLYRAVQASDKIAGSMIAKSLVARKGATTLVDDSLSSYFVQEKDLNLGLPLTKEQTDQVKKEHEEITKAKADYEKEINRLQEENNKLRAEQKVKKAASTSNKSKKTKAEFVAERSSILNDIREKIKSSRGQLSAGVAIKELVEISGDVAKLMKSYVEEGVVKLSDVIDRLHGELQGIIPEISKEDINNLIAGKYNENKNTKNEIARQVFELKQQAKLINRLNDLENGKEPKLTYYKKKRNDEIDAIRKKIKEHDSTRLVELKNRTQREIDKLEYDLANNNFAEAEDKAPLILDAKALELKDKLIALKQERNVRVLRQEYANRSNRQKGWDMAMEVLNVPRTIMSSMDLSAVGRQGLLAGTAHTGVAGRAFLEMIKQAGSQKVFDRWFYDVKNDKRYNTSQESGLFIADPHDYRLGVKEEQFMNNLAEKIPYLGGDAKVPVIKNGRLALSEKKYGGLIKGSERAYVGYLNKLRWDLFTKFSDKFEEQGKTFGNSPELYKGLANYINNSTGRGKLPSFKGFNLEIIAPVLNSVYFSPRLIASRLNLFNPLYYANMPKEVRVEAVKDLLNFISVGATVMILASLAFSDDDEFSIEFDPRSTDFLKMKHGKTRYDIWGGYQQYVRVISQVVMAQSKSTTNGKIKELDGKGAFGSDRGDVISRFNRGKLAPIPSMLTDLLTGKTVLGQDVTLEDELMTHLLPLSALDISKALEEKGASSLLTVGIPSLLGVGVSTYDDRKKSKK